MQKMDEHRIPLEELCYRFGTSIEKGLTTEAALKRNLEEGDNKLAEKKKTPAWIKFLIEISNWFSIMLWIGSILCIITYIIQPQNNLPNLYLGFILIFVILLTGTITFMQSAKSEALMEGFKNMLPSNSTVLRDGNFTQISPEKLVRGDVVQVISGEKVPADIRVISSNEMKVDNSALTG
jgi:sodium/potassium-transporting ATPase subunit alpha